MRRRKENKAVAVSEWLSVRSDCRVRLGGAVPHVVGEKMVLSEDSKMSGVCVYGYVQCSQKSHVVINLSRKYYCCLQLHYPELTVIRNIACLI